MKKYTWMLMLILAVPAALAIEWIPNRTGVVPFSCNSDGCRGSATAMIVQVVPWTNYTLYELSATVKAAGPCNFSNYFWARLYKPSVIINSTPTGTGKAAYYPHSRYQETFTMLESAMQTQRNIRLRLTDTGTTCRIDYVGFY